MPELITTCQTRHIDWLWPEYIAAIPTFIMAVLTRSLGWTVIAGMVTYADGKMAGMKGVRNQEQTVGLADTRDLLVFLRKRILVQCNQVR